MHDDSVDEIGEWRDVSISMDRAVFQGALLFPIILLTGLAPLVALWGWATVAGGFRTVFTPWYFFPGLVATVIVHEGLHAIGFIAFGRVGAAGLHFGVDRSTLSPYAGCRTPMRARAYRGAVLLPAVVLGVVPLVWGWVLGVGWLGVLGTLQLCAAAGDLVAYWAFRAVPGGRLVLDHPERVGCRVLDG
ncbi:MAG: DUF3267 domain-containing protein [Gemmatimonadota bacterium]